MNLNEIKEKHKLLIDKAIKIMNSIEDSEHNFEHIKDVVYFSTLLLKSLKSNYNKEVVIISAYWHDVGRSIQDENHEQISAKILRDEMVKLDYDNDFIVKCEQAIEYHKWNMIPKTIEGFIIKDADKLAWIGINRWRECLKYGNKLDSIINLLPRLRDEILYFDESKKIYDQEIVNLIKLILNN